MSRAKKVREWVIGGGQRAAGYTRDAIDCMLVNGAAMVVLQCVGCQWQKTALLNTTALMTHCPRCGSPLGELPLAEEIDDSDNERRAVQEAR